MQPAYNLIRRTSDTCTHGRTNHSPLLAGRPFPSLLGPRRVKARRLLAFSLVGALFAVTPASAHQWNFFPIGWAGPYSDGSTNPGHPERLCASFPSYACLVASTSYNGIGLVRWPIWVTNNQGLGVRDRTNDRDTPGWIVVIGQTGLSWSFQPTYEYSMCSTPNRCSSFTPGVASGIAYLPWKYSSGGTYYQATNHGSNCY